MTQQQIEQGSLFSQPRKVIQGILEVVGHPSDEAKVNADLLIESSFQLALGLLLADKPELMPEIQQIAEANAALDEKRNQVLTKLSAQTNPIDVEAALEVATKETMSLYFQKVLPTLSAEQRQKIEGLLELS